MTQESSQANYPRRGEIRIFHGSNGQQVGVVISECARNQQADDVLIVPLSSAAHQAPGQPLISSAVSGLSEDRRAKCSELTLVEKRNIEQGPLGTLPETVLMQIVRAIRAAIGDTLMHPVH